MIPVAQNVGTASMSGLNNGRQILDSAGPEIDVAQRAQQRGVGDCVNNSLGRNGDSVVAGNHGDLGAQRLLCPPKRKTGGELQIGNHNAVSRALIRKTAGHSAHGTRDVLHGNNGAGRRTQNGFHRSAKIQYGLPPRALPGQDPQACPLVVVLLQPCGARVRYRPQRMAGQVRFGGN